MKRAALAFVAALCLSAGAARADVTGAYASQTNNGTYDTYAIVAQKGDSVLVTINIVNMIQPGLFNSTQNTNIFSFGIGQLNQGAQTARVTFSGFTVGSCATLSADLHFAGQTLTVTPLTQSANCRSGLSAPQTYTLAF